MRTIELDRGRKVEFTNEGIYFMEEIFGCGLYEFFPKLADLGLHNLVILVRCGCMDGENPLSEKEAKKIAFDAVKARSFPEVFSDMINAFAEDVRVGGYSEKKRTAEAPN